MVEYALPLCLSTPPVPTTIFSPSLTNPCIFPPSTRTNLNCTISHLHRSLSPRVCPCFAGLPVQRWHSFDIGGRRFFARVRLTSPERPKKLFHLPTNRTVYVPPANKRVDKTDTPKVIVSGAGVSECVWGKRRALIGGLERDRSRSATDLPHGRPRPFGLFLRASYCEQLQQKRVFGGEGMRRAGLRI